MTVYVSSVSLLGVNATLGSPDITVDTLRFDAQQRMMAADTGSGSDSGELTLMTPVPVSTSPSTPSSSSSSLEVERVEFLNLVMLGVIGCCLAVLGLLGNCLSMVVLQRRQMRSSTSYFLLSLAVYDNLILLSMLAYFCLPALVPYAPALHSFDSYVKLTVVAGYPLSLAAQMGSIYTCVGFTIERFIAVCKPLHVANTCTKSRTIRVILFIFLWSLLYNIPRFFHYEIYTLTGSSGNTSSSIINGGAGASLSVLLEQNKTCVSASCAGVVVKNATAGSALLQSASKATVSEALVSDISSLLTSQSDAVSHYETQTAQGADPDILESLVTPTGAQSFPLTDIGLSKPDLLHSAGPAQISTTTLAPPQTTRTSYRVSEFGQNATFRHVYLIYSQLFFMFLIPFLAILIMNVGLIRAVKGSLSAQRSLCASARKEHNLTVMLIAVIVVFLVCQFPSIVDNILVAVFGEATLKANYYYWCFYTTCTLMVLINAASNFLLYCFFGKKFRLILLGILGCKRSQRHVAYRSTVCKSRLTNGVSRTYEMEVSVL